MSSSHIGQEAIELAALQEYLRQTGFGQPQAGPSSSSSMNMKAPRRRTSYAQLSNTPTAQSPLSTPSGWGGYEAKANAMEEEDEAMVEDLLIPPPPSEPGFHQSQYDYLQNSPSSRSRSTSSAHYNARPQQSQSQSSFDSFTSSDPFYLAQIQQARTHAVIQPSTAFQTSSSSFAVQPSSSPFYAQQHHQHHYQTHPHLAVDTHSHSHGMLVDMAPAYGR